MPALVKAVKKIFPREKVEELRKDCAVIFNCKSVGGSDDYSSGSTYFVKANETPRTALEELAQRIFFYHTEGQVFDPDHSGAEWWSQVIHPDDDIGVHWDRDYGLEEEFGQHVYPYVGTATYLSDIGAPTVVFTKPGTDMATEEIVGEIDGVVVSCPTVGSHIAFDGTMLHAAPADIFQSEETDDEDDDDDEESEESENETLSQLIQNVNEKRVTFLVNVWMNHVPSQSKRCEKKVIKKLSTPLLDKLIEFNDATVEHRTLKIKDRDLSKTDLELKFNNTDTNYDLKMPLPPLEVLHKQKKNGDGVFMLKFSGKKKITLSYAEDKSSSDEDEEEDEEEEEEVKAKSKPLQTKSTTKKAKEEVVDNKSTTNNKKVAVAHNLSAQKPASVDKKQGTKRKATISETKAIKKVTKRSQDL
jgi:hypothetical protein